MENSTSLYGECFRMGVLVDWSASDNARPVSIGKRISLSWSRAISAVTISKNRLSLIRFASTWFRIVSTVQHGIHIQAPADYYWIVADLCSTVTISRKTCSEIAGIGLMLR